MEEGDEEETPSGNVQVNGHSDGRNETSKTPARLTYEEYVHMSNLMILHLRSEEEKREGKKRKQENTLSRLLVVFPVSQQTRIRNFCYRKVNY